MHVKELDSTIGKSVTDDAMKIMQKYNAQPDFIATLF